MAKRSAGIVAFRSRQGLEVLLVHPGGPFFAKKDEGVWSIPKGEYDNTEDALTVAKKEFEEETGNSISIERPFALTPVTLKSGKIITAWAVEADFENCFIRSNTFEMEWPPKSGKMRSFPETDKAAWFTVTEAGKKVHPAQFAFIKELEQLLSTK